MNRDLPLNENFGPPAVDDVASEVCELLNLELDLENVGPRKGDDAVPALEVGKVRGEGGGRNLEWGEALVLTELRLLNLRGRIKRQRSIAGCFLSTDFEIK